MRRSYSRRAARTSVAGGAVGPGGDAVVQSSRRLARTIGLHPLAAKRLTSLAYSYTIGLRIDGVSGAGLRRLLERSGSSRIRVGGWTLLNVGDEGQAPAGAGAVGALGSRTAFHGRSMVVARSDDPRASLLGRGTPMADDPSYRFAARCLGDVLAARILPAFYLRSANVGVGLIAVGVTRDPARGEVVCAVDRSSEVAERQAAALRASLSPRRRDPVTRRRMGAVVSRFSIDRLTESDLAAVRARLELSSREMPGFVFRALTSAGVLDYLGSRQRPLHG